MIMRNTLLIAQRQFRSYFNGPVAYIVLCLMLLALGIFFWPSFFLKGRASVRDLFSVLSIILIFGAPAMSMGLLAEEKRTGTIELLITMPVREAEVIIGKYLGVLGLYAVLLVLTLPYPISVSTLGNLDWGPVWSGYLGIFLEGAALLAIGVAASSWTENQLVAFFVALVIGGLLWIVDRFVMFAPVGIASVLEWLSLEFHREPLSRGVIDTRDLLYFITLATFALLLAFRALESRRWK
ncbi:MAG: ABC transporter permease [Myxococcota bacterium]